MMAIMLSPANLALCLTLLSQSAMSGGLVGSPHRSLRVESQFLATDKENYDPFAEEHFYGHLKCGVTVQVGATDHKFEMCPEECPYYSQDLADDLHCSFVCVPATECAARNPSRPIADVIKGHKTCRGPIVPDCETYNFDGTDSCKKCQLFYTVGPDGLCHFNYTTPVYIIVAVIVLVTVFLFVWVIDCCLRTSVNEEGLRKGEKFRSLQKIRDPDSGNLYPFYSNLCQVDIAGPGMLLHFNMQVFIIVWAVVIACFWLFMALVIDDALFILGTRRFGTPRENCILVAWGYETQQRLMWTKVHFLVISYVFTFFFALAHALRQQNIFTHLDSEEKTMKDFMAFVTGLPECDANDPNAEKELLDFFDGKGVKKVVGVSIAWNFAGMDEDVQAMMQKDMDLRDEPYQKRADIKTWQEADRSDYSDEAPYAGNAFRKQLYKLEKYLSDGAPEDESKFTPEAHLELLSGIKSSKDAFLVFESEEDRDEAVGEEGKKAIGEFKGSTISIEKKVCEPDTIQWQHFGSSTPMQRLLRMCMGFGCILLALFFWCTVFYAPYAYQVFCFNYDNGAQPPFTLALTFCMVVVLGNAIMYEVCARVADFIGFKTRDDRESCYLILYVVACMFNVVLDMVTTYFLAEYILDGLGFRTYYGVRFTDVPTFTERFETYAMQRMLAENTKAYSFPATFLIPFLIEPFITVIVPYYLGKVLVRTHKEWVGRDAELFMAAFEFDMGRYGDLLLDMVLGILIFFFPGGYTLILFFGMAGSHAYIYVFDHCRVIRTIPKCVYASIDVDWWGCWMMAPITSMIPMCLVFKANCQDYGYCMKGIPLVEAMCAAYVAHCVFHTLVLLFVVPLFEPDVPDHNAGVQYKEAAAKYPCNWFTSNPIHCIRSKYIHKHAASEYCTFFHLGKEHILNQNEKLGLHFSRAEGEGEAFEDFSKSMKGMFKKKEQPPQEGNAQ